MRVFFVITGFPMFLLLLFSVSFIGQYFTGYHEYNDDRQMHGKAEVGYVEYLGKGHFIEATFKN